MNFHFFSSFFVLEPSAAGFKFITDADDPAEICGKNAFEPTAPELIIVEVVLRAL